VGWVSTLQNIIGDVAVIVIELGGSKNRSKRGCGIATRHFYRNGPFFLSILVAYRLSLLQGCPLRVRIPFFLEPSIPLLQDAGGSPN
jgi:hypothetical protein